MKLIVVLLLSLAASAQTSKPVITTSYGTRVVTAFFPCLNSGRGENVTFSATEGAILYYTLTNGKETGFFMFTGGGLAGKGETTGIQYQAKGSTQWSFANFIPYNPDGSYNGEGQFVYTDNYYVYSHTPGVNLNFIWHRTQKFEDVRTNGTNQLFTHPDEVVCR